MNRDERLEMAGDWIRMRACLATDPKVMAIGEFLEGTARCLNWATADGSDAILSDCALRYIVTGALHNAWCNANEHGDNDVVRGTKLDWIDHITGIPQFGAAMASVEWVQETPEGLYFPNFNRHNTSGAERQRRYRERHRDKGDVTRDVTRGATRDIDKRRGEKSSNTTLPSFDVLRTAWNKTLGVIQFIAENKDRCSEWKARMAESIFRDNWESALKKFPLKCFADEPEGWQPNIDWFLRPGTVAKIMEGSYDWSKQNGRPLLDEQDDTEGIKYAN